jgi:hypothetical protein
MSPLNSLNKLVERLQKIGIRLDLMGNFPWIYLTHVNGKRVKKEDWTANHGFTIAFFNGELEMTNLKETFNLIRKYK